MHYRNSIVKQFREHQRQQTPSRKITFTDARKTLVGDVGSIRRVFDFLEAWGLINYAPSAQNKPLKWEDKDTKSSSSSQGAEAKAAAAAAAAAADSAAGPSKENSKVVCSGCKLVCSIACFACDKVSFNCCKLVSAFFLSYIVKFLVGYLLVVQKFLKN